VDPGLQEAVDPGLPDHLQDVKLSFTRDPVLDPGFLVPKTDIAMKKLSIIALLFVGAILSLDAQNMTQALRYSQYTPFGTARYAALGGAIGALGADMTSMVTNPAGLAFYRSSDFSVSPSFYWVNTNSDFHGSRANDSEFRFNLASMGMVNAMTTRKQSGIVGAAFGFGYNTLANFNKAVYMQGISPESSLLDDFTWHANAYPDNLSPFYEQLAFDTYLMPYDENSGTYWHDMELDGYEQQLSRTSYESGYIGEYSLSGAINFSNLLYFGGTFGIHAVRYYEDIYHDEIDHDNHVLDFHSFRFREFNSTRGWGLTGRFGMILRPMQLLRIGASFHLPTYYWLTDEKYTDMSSTWDNGSGIPDSFEGSPNGIYDYELRTPWRITANTSLILFKLATVSFGYEYVDYSNAKLSAYDYSFYDENNEISQDLKSVNNFMAGAEIRLSAFYLRGGVRYYGSPYADTQNSAESWVYSGGLGVRTRMGYFDISYSHSNKTDMYGMYSYEPGAYEVSVNEINGNNIICTMGFKF